MSKLPKKIRVIGKDYKVISTNRIEHFGECCHGKLKIKINRRQDKQQLKDTVVHEILHAIDYSMQLDLEEHQVHTMATGLHAVLSDNPEFSKWLVES
jgi:hypothetical protein